MSARIADILGLSLVLRQGFPTTGIPAPCQRGFAGLIPALAALGVESAYSLIGMDATVAGQMAG